MARSAAFNVGPMTAARRVAVLVSAAALAVVSPASAQGEGDGHWDMLNGFCVDCHNFEDWAGGVAFDVMSADNVPADAEVWETTMRKLRGRLMPPAGEEQPDQADVDSFVAWMEAQLDAAAADTVRVGHVPIHRLNRAEYAVAVKGLLGVDVDPEAILPTEIEVEGFDNIAHALTISPSFLEQYVAAGRHVAHVAVGDPNPKVADVLYPANSGGQTSYIDGFPLGTRGGMKFTHVFPADGEYRVSLLDVGAGLYPRGMETESTLVVLLDDEEVFRTQLGGEEDLALVDRDGPEGRAEIIARVSDIPLHVTAGVHEVVITFIERSLAQANDQHFNGRISRVPTVLDGARLVGPFEPTGVSMSRSRQLIFSCYPESESEEASCAEDIARHLARRAFRRPVTDDDVAALMPHFAAGRAEKGHFDGGVEYLVAAVLASPDFLFRAVAPPEDPEATPIYPITDLELASRLSFFLWSQVPDEELLSLAAAGELSRPEVIAEQVERMLADPRAETLVTNFAMKWLNLDTLDEIQPERGFSDQMRENFETEVVLFMESVLLEERPVVDLLKADHTFLNESLARHYGVDGVRGPQFRRVRLEDERRWGMLGKGAVLLRTSYPDRTSPVLRGAWVLDKLVGTPPTPPPPNVETDLSVPEGELPTTVRARLEEHREDPTCNGCHGLIDPPGLALENFSVTGQWRDVDQEARAPIDATTELTSGIMIDGPTELRDYLANRPDQFAWNITEKLMMYALGRELEYYDMPQVRAIVRDAAERNYTMSAIVEGIVNSDAFRMQATPQFAALESMGEAGRVH